MLTFGQQKEKEEKVNKYLNEIKKYQTDNKFNEINSVDEKSFKEIERSLYEAKEIGEDVLEDSLTKDHYRWMEDIKKDKNNLTKKVKYGIVEGQIIDEIIKRHTYFNGVLIRVPVFMKAKILSYTPGYDKFGFRVIMKVQPEEILKCKVPYLLLNEFEVYFRDWGEGVSIERDFKVGKSYMIPIWYRPDIDITETKYSVATFVDKNGSRFLIDNGLMHDDYNIFGLGETVNWKVFADTVKSKIASIVNQENKK